jgi:hypothetical protein
LLSPSRDALTIVRAHLRVMLIYYLEKADVTDRDRDFRPSRRRDFADDEYQPPTRNFGYAPPHGPQFDSPSGPPVQATVKWYNLDKGFGFVTLADSSGDAFLHVSVVERSGPEACRPAPHSRSGPALARKVIHPRRSGPPLSYGFCSRGGPNAEEDLQAGRDCRQAAAG